MAEDMWREGPEEKKGEVGGRGHARNKTTTIKQGLQMFSRRERENHV